MKVTVQGNQNIYDLAKMYYGSVDGVYRLIADNPDTITDSKDAIPAGTILNIDSDPVDEVVVRQLRSREDIDIADKTVLANDDNYVADVWEDFSGNVPGTFAVNCILLSGAFIWVATARGLYRRKTGNPWQVFFVGDGLASNDVRWLKEHPTNGNIYAATAGGVSVFNGLTWSTSYDTTDGLPSNNCKWIDVYDGDWVVGTAAGLSVTSDWSSYTNYDSTDAELNGDDVRHGYIDRNGDMWLATDGGLSFWDLSASTVTLYTNAGGHLPSDDVVHVFESNGIIYIATDADGLVIYDKSNFITHDASGPNAPNDAPRCLDADSLGVVFCGFDNTSNGVMSVVRRRDSWSEESNSTTSDMPDDEVTCMTVDSENNIWVGFAASGLWYYHRNIFLNG